MITVILPDSIITKLRTTGLSSKAAGELLGVGPRQAIHLLRKAGATPNQAAVVMWRMV